MAGAHGRHGKKVVAPKPTAAGLAHVRGLEPFAFVAKPPETEGLREGERHARLCRALSEIVRTAVPPPSGLVGAGQSVYFRANDPSRALAPDCFVKLGSPHQDFAWWKSWERGAPDLAFEITSASDSDEPWSLDEKIARYHELGVRELVVFDLDASTGARLRVWDRLEDDFVERIIEDERTPCVTLGSTLAIGPVVVAANVEEPVALRLVRADGSFEPTFEEARSAAAELAATIQREQEEAEHARKVAADAALAGAQSQRAEALRRGIAYAAQLDAEAVKKREGM